ncbi:LysE family transporter [Crenobacter sp. SG2305]|uniref:LysE family translocator n=1 Tax=Crenobacter oryzisoli TaxID=3056844 RepID=UPI0025AA5B7B|nr:LysE family transporter [Crenobacter sp. SG2305]MDN0085588.1 LysE family transporter [Crenobacter sp. SG2305]
MLSAYFGEFVALATLHLLAVISPGPDFAVTVSQSVRHGRRIGMLTALGIGAGISVHVLYTLLGVGALMHAAPWLVEVAKVVGGAYVLYLGVQLLRAKPGRQAPTEQDAGAGQTASKAFRTGFLTNATNPKATLFFLAIFTTIVSPRTPLKVQALYGVWMCCVNAGWFMLVSALFSSPKVRAGFVRLGHWFERFMGLILVAFATRLVLSI